MSTQVLADPSAPAYARERTSALAAGARAALRFAASTVAGLVVGLVVAFALSLATGHRTFSVLSGSMEPAIHTGDAVVDEQIAPLDARVGDVVTFKDPSRHGQLVTHRLRSVRPHGGTVSMVTKGDANDAVEHWSVPVGGTIGRVVYRLPSAGRALVAIRGPLGRLLLIALPALGLAGYELRRIWRPRRDPR